MKLSPKYIAIITFIIFALAPLVINNTYILHILIISLIWCMVVSAWDLITGYGGIFSFGQMAFFVIGAYTSGILTVNFNLSPWLGILFAGLVTAIAGFFIAIPCLRVKGNYIALVTFALHLVLPTIISRGRDVLKTGGPGGLVGIPPLNIGSFELSTMDKIPWFYVILIFTSLTLFMIYYIIRSPFGLALVAYRDSQDFAQSLGVNEHYQKIFVFIYSAFFTGIAGSLYAHYVGSISQRLLGMDLFLLLMVMLTIGGLGRFPGAAIGAIVITFLNEFLRVSEGFRLIILGLFVVVVIITMPQGLIGLVDTYSKKLKRTKFANENN